MEWGSRESTVCPGCIRQSFVPTSLYTTVKISVNFPQNLFQPKILLNLNYFLKSEAT